MTGPLMFAAGCAVVAIGATAAVSLLGLRSALDVLLAWGLFATTLATTQVLVAGAVLERLSASLLLLLALVASATLVLVSRFRGCSLQTPLRRTLGRRSEAFSAARGDLWLAGLLVVACAELAWRLVVAAVMPPYAGDALWYHLTTVAGWIQADRIGPSDLSLWSTVHPQEGELLFTWTAVLLGKDTFVDAVQLPFAVLGAIAVAGIGRSCGLARRSAVTAGCLFLLTPIVLSQTTASYTDLMCVALVLTAYHFLLRAIDSHLHSESGAPTCIWLLLAGLAGGLAVGTKGLALPYMGVLTALLVVALVVSRTRHHVSGATLVKSIAAFVLPLVLVGGYHYLEIWARYGSPAYPVRVGLFGLQVFDGYPLDLFLSTPPSEGSWWREIWGQWHADHFFLTHPRFHAYSYDGRPSGLGPLWSYLGFAAVIAFAARVAWRSKGVLLTVVLPVTLMFALQPYRWWSRFTMILAAFGAIAIMALIEVLRPRPALALKAATTVLVALGLFFPTLKIDGEFWATRILSLATRSADERTIGTVALPGYHWLDSIPANASIGVDTSAVQFGGQPFILAYPLFGSDFRHTVYPLPSTSPAAFRAAVARHQITHVFVARGRLLDRWLTEALAAGCAHRLFDGHVYAGEAGRAYRIEPGCAW